jgi:hypothetical protein
MARTSGFHPEGAGSIPAGAAQVVSRSIPRGNPCPARHGTAEGEVMYIGIGTLLIIIILLAILL